jgi:hypothetical protein
MAEANLRGNPASPALHSSGGHASQAVITGLNADAWPEIMTRNQESRHMRIHLKAFTRSRGRARRAIRGGDFAAAERWDRLAERQLKLAFLHERALDELDARKETTRLEWINKCLEEKKKRASYERYQKAKAMGPLLQQEIDRRAAKYAEQDQKTEWSTEYMARQKAAELIRERG